MTKNLGTKITKIRELKLQKSGNKILKNISEKKSRNKNFKNQGTKITKYSEQKLQKSGNKS
jgi:hypothetical protein